MKKAKYAISSSLEWHIIKWIWRSHNIFFAERGLVRFTLHASSQWGQFWVWIVCVHQAIECHWAFHVESRRNLHCINYIALLTVMRLTSNRTFPMWKPALCLLQCWETKSWFASQDSELMQLRRLLLLKWISRLFLMLLSFWESVQLQWTVWDRLPFERFFSLSLSQV